MENEKPEPEIQYPRGTPVTRTLLRRVLLCAVVALGVFVAWNVQMEKTRKRKQAEKDNDLVHMSVDYGKLLDDEQIILPFSSDVFVGLRLAKAYPLGLSINFRFDAYLRVKEDKHAGVFVVSAVPKIVDDRVELGDWEMGTFDITGLSDEQVQSYNATGEAVFAMFKHKVKTHGFPLQRKATKIVQMTSGEIVVQ